MAFVAEFAQPQDADWIAGDWEAGGPPFFATMLVGPGADQLGGKELAAGDYVVWVKVVDQPEIPVRPAFALELY